jgi:hypothetical protein
MSDKAVSMTVTVYLIVKQLSDVELAVLNNIAQTDMDPHDRLFDYETVKSLFVEDGMRMHTETKIALAEIVNQRLSE